MISAILISVLVISAIAAALAALLVIAEYFLANYGECTVSINKDEELKVEGGRSLLATLRENKIFIPSACGGKGTCGLCKVKVVQGGGPLLRIPLEDIIIDADPEGPVFNIALQAGRIIRLRAPPR